MHREKFDSLVLIVLIIITVTVVLLHQYALERSLVIDSTTPYQVKAVSDLQGNDGLSEAKLIRYADHFILDCQLKASNYAWPYCEIKISFLLDNQNNSKQAIDLSSFTTVNLAAHYLGRADLGLRFHIRSFNKAFSNLDDENTWKYNGIEYWPEKNLYPVTIPMKSLQVFTWWLAELKIPIEHSAPEFEQVLLLQIATANNLPPDHYQIKLEKIEFVGKLFTNRQVYGALISLWLFSALIGLFINLRRSKVKLEKAVQRTKELKQLNRLLNVESQELKDQAERDPLTGALNREGIQSIFTNEIAILSLMFIDIDHFKAINDNYGHAVGDEILKSFAKLLSENCRSTDFLSRWGGEEFLLICPNTQLNEVNELAECLRILINQHQWAHDIQLSASFGVAQKGNESTTEFIARADKALYSAKAQGRNKVVVSEGAIIDSSIRF